MSVGALISVEEYLRTSYSPDCEFVDGEVMERNVGESPHSLTQSNFIFAIRSRYKGLRVWPEQRIQVSAERFRVPDVCVTVGHPGTDVFYAPPLIVLEILSKDDSLTAMQDRIADYAAFGVTNIWIADPRRREGYVCDQTSIRRVAAFEVAEPAISLPVGELFE
ncbi:MAG: Uma2 family endonuclease [Acidobacteria bacterium]|nr:Uma2 family endonuclease [Acidobacteriota bacterium]